MHCSSAEPSGEEVVRAHILWEKLQDIQDYPCLIGYPHRSNPEGVLLVGKAMDKVRHLST